MEHLDDLFGDGDADGLNGMDPGIAVSLDTDALFQRIERSHLVGCCQRLAWSKTGCVAYLSADCRKILIRTLFRDKKSAVWSLSDEAPGIAASEDATFVHIQWSSSGLELVAADQFGRLTVFASGYAINRLQRQPLNISRPHDNLGTVVGLHWLPTNHSSQSRTALVSSASKEGSRWVTNMRMHEVPGISNPLENKAAFLCITRKNTLKLIYQQPSQPWSEILLNLGDPSDSGDFLSHAAFCQASSHLVLATYDASKRLRLYRVHINWNQVPGEAAHQSSINPQLSLQQVELIDTCVPQSPEKALGVQLSSLQIESASPVIEHSTFNVIAVFTRAAQDNQLSQHDGGKATVISRWEIRTAEINSHDSFKNLKPTPAQVPATRPAATTLNRLNDVVLQKAIMVVQSNLYNNMFALAASDGTVEFRSRESMDIIIADENPEKVTSLPQNGFAYLPSDCIDISLSLSLTSSVITKPDGSIQLHNAEYLHGWDDSKSDNVMVTKSELAEAAIVSLARELSVLILYQSSVDDFLSLIPRDLDRSRRRKFLSEAFRTNARIMDYSLEDPKTQSTRVVKDILLHRMMAVQLIVSYQSDPRHRDIPAKTAWVLLNLRSVCMNIGQTMSMTQQYQGIGKFEPEFLISLKGLAKWSLDLFTLILDDLFSIMRSCSGGFDKESIVAQVNAQNTVALHLLLCSAPRPLLQMLGGLVRGYFIRCSKSQDKARHVREREELRQIEAMGSSANALFNIKLFELLIAETDASVRATYTSAQANTQLRNMYEQSMLVDADIPDVLFPVVQKLFSELVPKIEAQTDGVGIFAADTAWLGLGEDAEANQRLAKSPPYDVIRKLQMAPGTKTRQCRRCGSVTEDAVEGPVWVQNAHKNCMCLSPWIVV